LCIVACIACLGCRQWYSVCVGWPLFGVGWSLFCFVLHPCHSHAFFFCFCFCFAGAMVVPQHVRILALARLQRFDQARAESATLGKDLSDVPVALRLLVAALPHLSGEEALCWSPAPCLFFVECLGACLLLMLSFGVLLWLWLSSLLLCALVCVLVCAHHLRISRQVRCRDAQAVVFAHRAARSLWSAHCRRHWYCPRRRSTVAVSTNC